MSPGDQSGGGAAKVLVDRNTTGGATGTWAVGLVVAVVLASAVPVLLYIFVGPTAGLIGAALPVLVLIRGGFKVSRLRGEIGTFEPAQLSLPQWPLMLGRTYEAVLTRPRRDGGVTDFGDVRATLTCTESTWKVGMDSEGGQTTTNHRERVVHRSSCPVEPAATGGVALALVVPAEALPTTREQRDKKEYKVSWDLEIESAVTSLRPLSFTLSVADGGG